MALPLKSKGGFLNGVSGVIKSLTFKLGKSGKQQDGTPWQMYSGVLVVLPDGGKPEQQFLGAGFLDKGFSISKDGRTIEGPENYELDLDTMLGKFVESLAFGDGLRVPEELLGGLRNYDGIAETRASFVRVLDEKAAKEGRKRKSKKGKEFDYENLLVSEVLSLPPTAKGAKKTAAAPKPKATPAASAPAAAPAAPAAAAPAAGDTDAIVTAIITKAGGTIELAKLGAAAVRYGLDNKMDKNEYGALRELVISEEYLAGAVERNVFSLAGDGKDRVLVAA